MPRGLTTEEFISKAKAIHGKKYNYSKVIYKSSRAKVIITCPEHGDFNQLPSSHLEGRGCRKCSIIQLGKNRRMTADAFLSEAVKVHGNKYDYSKLNFSKATAKVNIICPDHGLFEQLARQHLKGNGCNECGILARASKKKISREDFIERSKKIQINKYDYTNLNFTGLNSVYRFHCEEHGFFEQKGLYHLYGYEGCKDCYDFRKRDVRLKNYLNYFLEQAKEIHKNKYDYSKVIYDGKSKDKGYNKKIEIICPEHGSFMQNPTAHLQGSGCFKCGKEVLSKLFAKSKNQFIKESNEIHNFRYSYDLVEYKNTNSSVKIICPDHGEFRQKPAKHLNGQGCPKCIHKGEGRLAEILQKKHIVYREFVIDKKRYDFYLPEYNLLIERDGEQHYSLSKSFASLQGLSKKESLKKEIKNDAYKTKLAKDNGYKIARIPYWLTPEEEEIEIDNILAGLPTYPDVPDLSQEDTKPRPKVNYEKSNEK